MIDVNESKKTTIKILMKAGNFEKTLSLLDKWIDDGMARNGYFDDDEVYWLHLLAKNNVKTDDELISLGLDFSLDEDFLFAVEYASDDFKAQRISVMEKSKKVLARRLVEEKRKKEAAEAEARRLAEEKRRKEAEEAEKRRIAEEMRRKEAAEAEERRLAEEKLKKEAEEAEARRIAEEKLKKEAEEAEKRRIAEEKRRKEAAEAEERRIAEEKRRKEAEEATPKRNGDVVYFGSYPQTRVTDNAIISALGSYASNSWKSYGYYIDGKSSDYMKYTDKTYNGEKYRGVYFTNYRPKYCTNSSSADNSYQDDNGYYTSTIYWFKYEPIKWKILNEGNGEALLFADLALDSQQYDYDGNDDNNYANSTIRAWLNETFYNTAFNSLQQQLIKKTTVDNSAASTGYSSNQYACANTEDNLFLLSYAEVTNSSYGFNSSYSAYDTARQKKISDYAKSQGCWQNTDSSYRGNCWWWLRSSYFVNCIYARYVRSDGDVSYGDSGVSGTDSGVLPALVIRLS